MFFEKRLVDTFKNDLCKDQREIKILPCSKKESISQKIMRKYSTSFEEFENEISVINFLRTNNVNGIPRVISSGKEDNVPFIDIEYYDGIRVYNVLAYLRDIAEEYPDLKKEALECKRILKKKCLNRQKIIQKKLVEWSKTSEKKDIYPQQKIINIVNLLLETMQITGIDIAKMNSELNYIINEFNKNATIPFRDSTTKNMVLYIPELYLKNFIGKDNDVFAADDIRKEYFVKMMRNGEIKKVLEAQIIDFDFATCEHLTTIYDDPIGYNCHEILFTRIPNTKSLKWNCVNNVENEGKCIAISFIIRYLRFGGRKLCYHIFHPNAYKFRFRYDNEYFYFHYLEKLVKHFWPESTIVIPEFLKFINAVDTYDKSKIIDDVDEFELEFPNSNRKFYIDIFPY